MKANSTGNTKFIVYNQSLFGTGEYKKKILRKKFTSFNAIHIIRQIEIPDNPIEIVIRDFNFLTYDNAQIDLIIVFEVVPNINEKDVEKFAECVPAFDTEKYPLKIESPKDWLVSYVKSDIDILRNYTYQQIISSEDGIIEKLSNSLQKKLFEKNFIIYSEIKIRLSIKNIEDYNIENPHHHPIIEYLQKTSKTKQLELITRNNDFQKDKNLKECELEKIMTDLLISKNSELERNNNEQERHKNEEEKITKKSLVQRKAFDLTHKNELNKIYYLELAETLASLKNNNEYENEISILKYDNTIRDFEIGNNLEVEKEKQGQELYGEKLITIEKQIKVKEKESLIKKEDISLDYEGERIRQEILTKTEIELQAISLVQKMLDKELLLTYFKLEKESKTETISNIANTLSSSLNSLTGGLKNLKTINFFDTNGINSIINIITQLSSSLLESIPFIGSIEEIVKNKTKNTITFKNANPLYMNNEEDHSF